MARQLRLGLAVFLALTVLTPGASFAKEELPEPHDDALVEERMERFEAKYASDDMDDRLSVLRWWGQHRHKLVLKSLKKIWLKEKDLELKAAAAEGLGHQLSHPKDALKLLVQGLEKNKKLASWVPETDEDALKIHIEEQVLVKALESLGRLGRKADWKKLKGFIDHNSDPVAIAAIQYFSAVKEYKAIPVIYQWFEHYPDGVSWSGGSVRVDTGAAGNTDAKAAKAKWKAKYGGRAKKARPNAFAAMVECVKVLTGEEIEKRDDLKAWMDANKVFLKKHGV